jgi:hypothetical protein
VLVGRRGKRRQKTKYIGSVVMDPPLTEAEFVNVYRAQESITCRTTKFEVPACQPVFVNLLSSPGNDSQPDGPVHQPYLTHLHARLHRLAESIPWNRFLKSIPGLLETGRQLNGTVSQQKMLSSFLSPASDCLYRLEGNRFQEWIPGLL